MFESEGKELAKVLYYYGLVNDADTETNKVHCPFHADDNPSMAVSYEKGIATCYVCGLTLDAFRFVKEIEATRNNNTDELKQLREFVKILKSKEVRRLKYIEKKPKTKRQLKQQLNKSYDYYNGLDDVDWKNSKDEEVIRCKKYMLGRGFKSGILSKFGAKVTYNNSYPIMFPIMDNGNFKGYVCRTDVKRVEEKRKYLYNTGFSHKTTLAGTYGNTKICVLCEGYMDLIKAYQNGLRKYDICALFGWKISEEQVKMLKDAGVEEVVSMLDNDECGIKGTKELEKHFKVHRFKYLKGYKDTGEMDKETFLKCWNRTKDINKL